MNTLKIIKLHRILPTTDNNYKSNEIMINIEKISYFYPTVDGKYTMIMFDANNQLMVSESFEEFIQKLLG